MAEFTGQLIAAFIDFRANNYKPRMVKLSSQQLRIAFPLLSLNFLLGCMFSLHAPFYPALAEKLGVTPTVYGLVLGVYHIGIFVTSPLIGRLMHKINPRCAIVIGSVTAAVACTFLGLMDEILNKHLFICASILLRICESVGLSVFLVVMAALTLSSFSDFSATMMSWNDTAFGTGMILGPVIGGLLFEIKGFKFPFMVVGSLTFLIGLSSIIILPKEVSVSESKQSGSITSILKLPGVWIGFLYTFISAICLGFIFVSLQPHASALGMDTMGISWMFVVEAACFVTTSPLWGFMMDKKVNPRIIMLAGLIFSVIGVSFIGPLPIIPNLKPHSWACFLGLALFGIGNSAEYIPGIIDPLRVIKDKGFADTIETASLVSGIWYSIYSLGSFIGPTIGGALYEHLGYQFGSLVMVGIHLPMFIVTIASLVPVKYTRAPTTAADSIDDIDEFTAL